MYMYKFDCYVYLETAPGRRNTPSCERLLFRDVIEPIELGDVQSWSLLPLFSVDILFWCCKISWLDDGGEDDDDKYEFVLNIGLLFNWEFDLGNVVAPENAAAVIVYA